MLIVFKDYKIVLLKNETRQQFRDRVCKLKREHCIDGMTWGDVCNTINEAFGVNYSESYYRKNSKKWISKYDVCKHNEDESKRQQDAGCDYNIPKVCEEDENIIELKKAKMKLSEERVQANAYIRRLSREETLKEIAHDAVVQMDSKKILDFSHADEPVAHTDNEAILLISDWHYGIICDNFWNKYDTDVAEKRLSELFKRVVRYCRKNDVHKITVLNLGDLICGRIHLTLRLESRIDVITQIMKVSEILAEFLLNLLKEHFEVSYCGCIDNHSRVEPVKTDALELETLARITPWYLKERLKNTIHIYDNTYGQDIITFDCNGYSIAGVHGDKDTPRQVADSISMITRSKYDLICSAHLHHHSEDEKNYTEIISNGSLMGTDSYAKGKRLTSRPSQTLIITTPISVREVVYKIDLD